MTLQTGRCKGFSKPYGVWRVKSSGDNLLHAGKWMTVNNTNGEYEYQLSLLLCEGVVKKEQTPITTTWKSFFYGHQTRSACPKCTQILKTPK